MPEEKNLILEARHVTRRFPAPGGGARTACDDVSLKFYRGETLGLIGESGCGKSTLMRLLVRLDVPDEGEILYQGTETQDFKGRFQITSFHIRSMGTQKQINHMPRRRGRNSHKL